MSTPEEAAPAWEDLLAAAQEEVGDTLRALPKALRASARALPVTYERRPNQAVIDDGIDPDTLGLFVGGNLVEGDQAVLPAQIILYLLNLWDMVADEGGDEADYRLEVRTTLMHELGHYLGLDEDDLGDRGLD
jgi:predicted Zn-dependent protease with MMP-like domain